MATLKLKNDATLVKRRYDDKVPIMSYCQST